jgi:hypothetical protein
VRRFKSRTSSSVAALLLAAAPAAHADPIGEGTAPHVTVPSLISAAGIAAAQRYARTRTGDVAFSVADEHGRLRGLDEGERFPSASVVKAMLLVAVLRRDGSGAVSPRQAALLAPMITVSDNDAAETIFDDVGAEAVRAVARAAGMRDFFINTALFEAQITAADQARFFLEIDRLVPARHRAYARSLLSGITPAQRWGIAPVAQARGFTPFFKGGWRTGITHQVALLERGGQRIALAVLTSGDPSIEYGEATLSGIADRVLAP